MTQGVSKQAPFDWGSFPLTRREAAKRTRRVSGETRCAICGRPYREHPWEPRILDWDDYPFLRRGCDGSLLKL